MGTNSRYHIAAVVLQTTTKRSNPGYVNLPMSFNGTALPPKPSITPKSPDTQGIPYGYENVLPISQRYQQNPYSMLSSAATDTATSITCTSDEESEYITRQDIVLQKNGDRRKLMKLAIAQHTIIEKSAEN